MHRVENALRDDDLAALADATEDSRLARSD
jgi:hypothetical protein